MIAHPGEENATHFGIFWSLFHPRRFVCSHRSPRRELSKIGTMARERRTADHHAEKSTGGWKICEKYVKLTQNDARKRCLRKRAVFACI